jgi:hypothetical protein
MTAVVTANLAKSLKAAGRVPCTARLGVTVRVDGYAGRMRLGEDPQNPPPEVDPEDLRKHGGAAVRLVHDLAPGESARWADLVNTAASMAEIEDQGQL